MDHRITVYGTEDCGQKDSSDSITNAALHNSCIWSRYAANRRLALRINRMVYRINCQKRDLRIYGIFGIRSRDRENAPSHRGQRSAVRRVAIGRYAPTEEGSDMLRSGWEGWKNWGVVPAKTRPTFGRVTQQIVDWRGFHRCRGLRGSVLRSCFRQWGSAVSGQPSASVGNRSCVLQSHKEVAIGRSLLQKIEEGWVFIGGDRSYRR